MSVLSKEQQTQIATALQLCYLDMLQGSDGTVDYDSSSFDATGDNIQMVFEILDNVGLLPKGSKIYDEAIKEGY